MRAAKPLLLHLPLMATGAIIGFFALVDAGRLPSLRTESTFGWMLVFWYPLCILLVLTQLVLWGRWIHRHGIPLMPRSGRARHMRVAGLLILAAVLSLFVFRVVQRYGLFQG